MLIIKYYSSNKILNHVIQQLFKSNLVNMVKSCSIKMHYTPLSRLHHRRRLGGARWGLAPPKLIKMIKFPSIKY